jgi:hypothetical protein
MIEEALGVDVPCDVCGRHVDDCICPECPECAFTGDPKCYKEHGMIMSQEQIESRAAADKAIAEENTRWEKYVAEFAADEEAAKKIGREYFKDS